MDKANLYWILILSLVSYSNSDQSCTSDKCGTDGQVGSFWKRRYILYDVNPGEGFNLRRDVYMRMATLVRKLQTQLPQHNWVLVLPPWGPLYHWKSSELQEQVGIPWKQFFDLESLNDYVPVIELDEFIKESSKSEIEQVYTLQHYRDTFSSTNQWTEKYDVATCINRPSYKKKDEVYVGSFWAQSNIYAKKFACLSIQGHVSNLAEFLSTSDAKSVMIDHAEIILHDMFGDSNYWKVRSSMAFAKDLIHIANEFRKTHFDSSDEADQTVGPSRERHAIGGPYVAVHLRRRDYLYAHPDAVPQFPEVVKQIKAALDKYDLKKVFVATDAYDQEYAMLAELLPEAIRFKPTQSQLEQYLDGGVAIIDQWICAHARHFIGTSQSTFSFRIQEEREILGFQENTTFNSFCKNSQVQCEQPSKWTIVY